MRRDPAYAVIHDQDPPDGPDELDRTGGPEPSGPDPVGTDPVEAEPAEVGDPGPGVEPEERRYPSTLGGACYLVVLAVGAAAVVVAALGDWRLGVRLLAGALGGAALSRLVLPQRDAGMLAVRHRLLDVALLVAVGVTLWVLAGDIPDQPGPVGVPG